MQLAKRISTINEPQTIKMAKLSRELKAKGVNVNEWNKASKGKKLPKKKKSSKFEKKDKKLDKKQGIKEGSKLDKDKDTIAMLSRGMRGLPK